MALEKISDKQKEILEFIKSEILNRGYPPSVRDICEGVHLKSTSSVHAHLETLERKGGGSVALSHSLGHGQSAGSQSRVLKDAHGAVPDDGLGSLDSVGKEDRKSTRLNSSHP